MPKLRETYQQIQERNAREIRQRTRDRVRALLGEEELVIVEDQPDVPIVVAKESYIVCYLVCIVVLLVIVCLSLSYQLYLAKER
jgi:hypothetical protein